MEEEVSTSIVISSEVNDPFKIVTSGTECRENTRQALHDCYFSIRGKACIHTGSLFVKCVFTLVDCILFYS